MSKIRFTFWKRTVKCPIVILLLLYEKVPYWSDLEYYMHCNGNNSVKYVLLLIFHVLFLTTEIGAVIFRKLGD